MSYFFNILGQSAEIDVYLDGQETRKSVEVENEDRKKERMLLYYDGESVTGKVNIILKKSGPKLEHQGIKIEFIGQIEILYDRGNHHEFTNLVKELARPGELMQNVSYPFEFARVEKPFEIYSGINVRLRYFLKVTIIKRMADVVKEIDIAVHALSSYPEVNNPIKMEVGIEDCLHIEFEYNKSKYHLRDVIVGKIYFLLVRIKIKHMDLAIIKRETAGQSSNPENETVIKYQIMDGAPVKGESIPIRVFLAGCNLTPTMRDINKKFSVRYFLNLVLMDMEDRRYFKQQEITLWRKGEVTRKANLQSPLNATHLVSGDSKPPTTTNTNTSASNTQQQQQHSHPHPPPQQMHTGHDGTASPPLQVDDSDNDGNSSSGGVTTPVDSTMGNPLMSPTEMMGRASLLQASSEPPPPPTAALGGLAIGGGGEGQYVTSGGGVLVDAVVPVREQVTVAGVAVSAPSVDDVQGPTQQQSNQSTPAIAPEQQQQRVPNPIVGVPNPTMGGSNSIVDVSANVEATPPPARSAAGIEHMTREAGDGETRTEPMLAEE